MRIKPKSAYENTLIYYLCDKVISSYIFICTSWFYSHSSASAHVHEIYKIDKYQTGKRYTRL